MCSQADTRAQRGGGARALVALHVMLAVYSLSSVCAKLASGFEFLSPGFVACYGGMIALLGVYAIGWQQVIKLLPLTYAYANKAVTVLWGIVWGVPAQAPRRPHRARRRRALLACREGREGREGRG